MKRRVVITAIGLQTALGSDVDDFFLNLINGVSGIRKHPALELCPDVAWIDFNPDAYFSKLEQGLLDRFSQLALVACQSAMADARLPALLGARAGVYMGTGGGGSTTAEESYRRYFSNLKARIVIPLTMNNAASSQLAIKYGVLGECQSYSTACSSASVAIGEAFRRVRDGYMDIALAGGSDAPLVPAIMAAWRSMGVLCKTLGEQPGTGCRPFSKERTGFAIGEGAGVLVLETLEGALSRGAQPLAEIVGYGVSSDAAHITKPDSNGQARAMKMALAEAGAAPEQVGYVNAHGTATPQGDAIEVTALKDVFGEHLTRMPISSTKAAHGHMMGASGAIELAATILALQRQVVPPTLNWSTPDPSCDIDCVPGKGRVVEGLTYAMCNSFAFGGNNASLLVKRFEAPGAERA